MDALTLALTITHRAKTVVFQPQFMGSSANGDFGYTPQLQMNVNGFVGWLPSVGKIWPEAQDKLAFKAFARQAGLHVPAWTTNAQEVKGAFIVKSRQSSFGRGLRGPFFAPPPPAPQSQVPLAPGEYFEQFIVGQLVKAWYWNGELAVAEIAPMPSLRGDGKSSLRELLRQRLGITGAWQDVHSAVVALWGLNAESVPAAGTDVAVDYRYMSDLNPAIATDHNVLPEIKGTPLADQLLQAGSAMHAVITAEAREHTAMTFDGVVDPTGRVHFLEVNCNPLIHPAFYTPMLDAIFLRAL